MTKKMMSMRKKPPETPYTMAEVREMDTELSVMMDLIPDHFNNTITGHSILTESIVRNLASPVIEVCQLEQ